MHDGHHVIVVDGPAVDLLQEMDGLVEPAELGVVVLDVARGELLDALDIDGVDDRLEDLLARRVLESDRDEDDVALLVLRRLVAQTDGRGLAPTLELVDEDWRVEVQYVHGTRAAYRPLPHLDWAAAATCLSPRYASSLGASASGIHSAESTSWSWFSTLPER